jgi:uncharacterized protein YdaU (DUF1376 family)
VRHFAHHIGDYRAHTAHLSFVEDAAYRRMLDTYYMHEKPLPKEVNAVQRLVGARSKEEREAVAVVLQEFFSLQDDGWHQARADEEIAGYLARVDIARENGRKSGGRPKPKKEPTNNRPDNQVGLPSVPTKATNQEPLAIGKAPTGLSPDGSVETPRPVAARGSLEGSAHGDMPEIPKFLKRMPG